MTRAEQMEYLVREGDLYLGVGGSKTYVIAIGGGRNHAVTYNLYGQLISVQSTFSDAGLGRMVAAGNWVPEARL